METELLSPAGSIDSLKAAIYNGADAVYLGLNKFNARNKAENFNEENIYKYIEFAHLFGVKVYVAFNTIIKNNEIEDFLKLLDVAVNAKADAFIVQSIGIARLIKRIYPNAILHASTQMGIHNKYGALFCKNEGFKRIILSRECTLDNIKDISNNVDIEIEAFIHGALCVSFSGGCYMSSFISCNSGNRGLCLQPCRMLYTAYNQNTALKKGYLLSLSDLCLNNDINELINVGVKSLKIEGRLKRCEYTGEVTKFYRNILNGKKPNENDIYNIKTLFNRGDFTKGYYFDNNDIAFDNHQGHKGYNIGKVLKVYKNIIEIKSNKQIACGDCFKLFDKDIETGNAIFNKHINGNVYHLIYKGKAKKDTLVNITTDYKLNKEIKSRKKYLNIHIDFTAKLNEKCIIKVYCKNISANVISDYIVQKSVNIKTSKEDLKQKLKIENDIFLSDKISINIDDNCFIPLSIIKKLKREALAKLKDLMLKKYDNLDYIKQNIDISEHLHSTMQSITSNKTLKKACIINKKEQIDICKDAYIYIYRPNNYNDKEISNFFNTDIKNIQNKLYLYLPSYCNTEDIKIIKNIIKNYNFAGLYINNIFGLELAKEYYLKVFMGIGMNLYNNFDIEFAKENSQNYVYSFELSKTEINLFDYQNGFVYAYGNIDLMTLNNCIVKSIYDNSCNDCKYKGIITLKDNKGINFYVNKYKISKCYFNVINGKKINILNKELPNNNLLFDFTNENDDTIKNIYNLKNVIGDYTSGHMYRSLK